MAIDAGKLDRTIQLLAKSTTRDAVGQARDTWTVVATTNAQRMNLTTADMTRGAGKETIPEGKYLIRYRAGVTNDMRVAVDGQTFAITSVDTPDRRQSLILIVQGV